VNEARARGGRAIAVGTTTVRALESAWNEDVGEVAPMEASTDLFILPGYRFKAVDGIVTNFHTPRSTLLMMVSAFAGRELVMHAYRVALEQGYRFLSFGDAMLVL
jgi:S-adenosylmethionine:tRNA ribosyltransferase-isomerase